MSEDTRRICVGDATTICLDSKRQWLQGVLRLLSPNCNDRPAGTTIDLLVIHAISLPPGKFGDGYVQQLFCNTLPPRAHPDFVDIADLRVSAHLFIDRSGEVTQFVPFQKRAWHAGSSSFDGRENCNDFSIGIELEGADTIPYTAIQYRVLAAITDCLVIHWPGICRQRIVAHSTIAPQRKSDPGEAFAWDFYFSLCRRV